MVAKLPRKIAAATGVDALAHAIECWTSNKANPFSGLFAMHALDLLLNNLLPACNEQDMQARQNVQLASFLAGVAITASGGACAKLSARWQISYCPWRIKRNAARAGHAL